MKGAIENLFATIFNLLFVWGVASFSFSILEKETIKKIDKGLSSSYSFSQRLTCKKFNKKMEHVKISGCAKTK